MTTTHRFNSHTGNLQLSPPVSPKSQPHGYKRKLSTQEDELDTNSHISYSFKKLRLGKPTSTRLPALPSASVHLCSTDELNSEPDSGKQLSATDITPIGVSYRDLSPPGLSLHLPVPRDGQDVLQTDDDDFMPVDDTADRIWVRDLDAEIATIEAEEAQQRQGIHLSDTGNAYSKIPDHLLKPNSQPNDAASHMQIILYRDPISISVPEQEDAVRKTIIEARRRMREKQVEDRVREELPSQHPVQFTSSGHYDDDMEID